MKVDNTTIIISETKNTSVSFNFKTDLSNTFNLATFDVNSAIKKEGEGTQQYIARNGLTPMFKASKIKWNLSGIRIKPTIAKSLVFTPYIVPEKYHLTEDFNIQIPSDRDLDTYIDEILDFGEIDLIDLFVK